MDALQVLQNFGLAVCLLFVLGFAMWRSLRWLGERVLVPLVTAHIAFLQSVEKNLELNSKALEKISAAQDQIVVSAAQDRILKDKAG